MPNPEVVTHAIVLGHEPRGETYMAYRLLSEERGTVTGLVRRSSKPNKQTLIDLFDEGEFRIELKPGSSSGFVKDAQIVRKRSLLARNYQAFESAARFSKMILANPAHEENIGGIFDLLSKGLDAWETRSNPRATYFKCLYLYCRQEGYPVKEEWVQNLPPDEKAFILEVLNRPLRELSENAEPMTQAIDKLEHYVRHRTHIRLGFSEGVK